MAAEHASVGQESVSVPAPKAVPRRMYGLAARRLAVLLGLGDLTIRRPCHGYANGCSCDVCEDRDRRFGLLREKYGATAAAELAKRDAQEAA